MKEITVDENFNIDDLSEKISAVMSKWSIHFLDINGPDWAIYDYEMDL